MMNGASNRYRLSADNRCTSNCVSVMVAVTIAQVQAILPIATHCSRLSHLWTLLKPFDGFRCHLARPLLRSNHTLGDLTF